MKLDIRILVIAALATVAKEKGKTVISFNDLIKYKELLEKKYEMNFDLAYTDKFNESLYQQNIDCRITNGNVYFSIKFDTHPSELNNMINQNLLLNDDDTKKFTSEYDSSNELIKKQIADEYLDERLESKNSLEEFLGKSPSKNIFFEDFMAIYILQYSRFCGNIIDNNKFYEDIEKISEYLNEKNITFVNPNKFNLFIFLRRNSKYINMNNGTISINIDDIRSYYESTIKSIKPELYNYISNLLEIYMIKGSFNPDLLFQNKKDIAWCLLFIIFKV